LKGLFFICIASSLFSFDSFYNIGIYDENFQFKIDSNLINLDKNICFGTAVKTFTEDKTTYFLTSPNGKTKTLKFLESISDIKDPYSNIIAIYCLSSDDLKGKYKLNVFQNKKIKAVEFNIF
jgi:hypothetical protein